MSTQLLEMPLAKIAAQVTGVLVNFQKPASRLAPVSPTPELRALLNRAADRLDEWGWTSNTMLDRDSGQVCALWALLGAVPGISRERQLVNGYLIYRFVSQNIKDFTGVMTINYPAITEASDLVRAHCSGSLNQVQEDPTSWLVVWNDICGNGELVKNTFREVAAA